MTWRTSLSERFRGFALRSGRAGAAHRVAGAAITGIALVLIGLLTLWPSSAESVSFTPPSCVFCTEQAAVDGILNLLLFAPLGVGLSLLGFRVGAAALIALALTVGVEVLQFGVVTGRDASIADIIANGAGGILGIALGRLGGVLAGPGPRVSRLLLVVGSLVWVAVMAAAAWLMHPRFHLRTTNVLERPLSATGAQFQGRVLQATLGELELFAGAALDGEDVRRLLLAGEEVRARIAVHELAREQVTILKLIGPFGRELLWLGESEGALLWRAWQNSTVAHLGSTTLRLPASAVSLGPGDTIDVHAGVDEMRLWLRVAGPGGEARREIRLSPAASWSLLLPLWDGIDAWQRPADAAWLALLLFPLGYWGRLAGSSRERSRSRSGALPVAVAGASVVFGLAIAPALVGSAMVGWWGWIGALVGLALGGGVAEWVRHRMSSAGARTLDEDEAAVRSLPRFSESPP